MTHSERRRKLRAMLAEHRCRPPASVYDPISARIAESVGFELGLLSGSMVAATTLAAPDLVLHTATEFAEQIRRIQRASGLCLLVDADHGYGNALNVMRTVWEFEHAGVTALGIEDSILPPAFGHDPGHERLAPIEEAVGKYRAALTARGDSGLIIAARTVALKVEGLDSVVARARAYAEAGVDAIWMTSLARLDELEAVHGATGLPVILGSSHGPFSHAELASRGARIALQGHLPLRAAAKALRAIYAHLHGGGAPADYLANVATEAEMDALVHDDMYENWFNDFMGG